MATNPLIRYKGIIIYGASLALLVFLLKWLEWRLLIFHHSMEIYVGAIALLFTGLGIWLSLKLTKPKVERVVVEKEVFVEKEVIVDRVIVEKEVAGRGQAVDVEKVAELQLSQRELEVLRLMAEGLSNQEIADRLYVSLNTIKTHSSRIFEKMDVKRRTQAVEMAQRLRVI
jgi:NarL family two-component system response regulator LiaR